MLISALIDAVLNETLIGTYRAHYNQVSGSLDASVTQVTMKYPISGIGENSYIEVDNEIMYVYPGGVDETAKRLNVVRGVRGSTAATHADGATVSINPRFPRISILKTMQEEARSWPISMFQVEQHLSSMTSTATHIDLAADMGRTDILRVVKVWRQNTDGRWIVLPGWRFEKDMLSAGSADLYLENSLGVTTSVQILVARPFSGVSSWTEASDITAAGMADSVGDVLKYGAAWRLVTGRETRRLFTEVESEGRLAQEVPPAANLTLGRSLKQLRDIRLGEEMQRLRSYYGITFI